MAKGIKFTFYVKAEDLPMFNAIKETLKYGDAISTLIIEGLKLYCEKHGIKY